MKRLLDVTFDVSTKSILLSGEIRLRHLSISGSKYGQGEIKVAEGQSVMWSAPSKSSLDVKELLSELKR